MWKTKIEEWIASLIPYINVPLDQYDPTEWRPKEISPQFLEDVDGKSELITLLNPQLTYNETTTGYMIKLRTMIDLLELLEKRGVNVEQYVIRRKETPEAPVYEGPLQTVLLDFTDDVIEKAHSGNPDKNCKATYTSQRNAKELLKMRDVKIEQLNKDYGLNLTKEDIHIVENKLIISAGAENPIKQAKHQKEMADVFIAAADERELKRWEATLPAYTINGIEAFYGETFVILDNLLVNVITQKVVAELKTEEERKVWSPTGCDFKPTRRKFSKSIRAKLDETRKSARQNDLQ